MAGGPAQLLVLGFDRPDDWREMLEELEKLRESDTIRVVDSLAVAKSAEGELEVLPSSDPRNEAAGPGTVAALIGLDVSDANAQAVLEEVSNGSGAALLLIEHHWVAPFRDAIVRAGGLRLVDGLV